MENTQIDAAITKAAEIGRRHGKNAASWVFDGNTSNAVLENVRRGIDEGDPEILDRLPGPDLSGQWADGYSSVDLYRDVDFPMENDFAAEITQAYEEAFSDEVESEVSKAIAYQLDS